ncbi:MAG: hypothetical protein KF712_14030 [Akkermansiaceae bacterium]|nr:hypothetical protein [Akkermansiaceae bacterium]
MRSRNPDRSRIEQLEQTILQHPDLRKQVTEHVRNGNRDVTVQAFDPSHRPGILRIVRIPKGTKVRITYSPDDRDYVQSLYWYLGILLPITESHLCDHTHAYRPRRGIQTEIRQILSVITTGYDHQVVIAQEDVKFCFDHAPIALILHMLPPWTAGQVILLQQRYRETVIPNGMRPQGGPQGHPAICALVNLVLDHILAPTRKRFEGHATLINFSDDFAFVGTGDYVREMRKEVQAALNAHGMTLNPDKRRTTRVGPGAKVIILGLEFEWMAADPRPIIRPKRQAYRNLSDKIAGATHNKHIQAIIRSWKAHYIALCNDADHDRRTQEAISEGLRRHSAGKPQTSRPNFGGI